MASFEPADIRLRYVGVRLSEADYSARQRKKVLLQIAERERKCLIGYF